MYRGELNPARVGQTDSQIYQLGEVCSNVLPCCSSLHKVNVRKIFVKPPQTMPKLICSSDLYMHSVSLSIISMGDFVKGLKGQTQRLLVLLPRPLGLEARRVVVEVALADGRLALLALPLQLHQLLLREHPARCQSHFPTALNSNSKLNCRATRNAGGNILFTFTLPVWEDWHDMWATWLNCQIHIN